MQYINIYNIIYNMWPCLSRICCNKWHEHGNVFECCYLDSHPNGLGPRTKWARAQRDLGPNGPRVNVPRAQMVPGPNWSGAQMGLAGPNGLRTHNVMSWAQDPHGPTPTWAPGPGPMKCRTLPWWFSPQGFKIPCKVNAKYHI